MVRVSEIQQPGRRERHKARMREQLITTARELFARQGFAETTVLQITDTVDVSQRTFFRYFDSKEDLLLVDLVDFFDAVANELHTRPSHEPPLVALYESLVVSIQRRLDDSSEVPMFRPRQLGIDLTSQLARTYVNRELRVADILAERLLNTTEDPQDARIHADVAAVVGVSVLRSAVNEVTAADFEAFHLGTKAFTERLVPAFDLAALELDRLVSHYSALD